MSKPTGWWPAICSAGLLLLSACQRAPETPSLRALPVAPVQTVTVEKRRRAATEEVVGSVRARLHAGIEAKLSGRIVQMLAVPGQTVEAGALLAELDSQEVKARLDQAMAVREQANQDLKRVSDLFKQQVASQQEFDTAQSRARVAQASVAEAETMLGYTRVLAPFSGIITRKLADVGDLAAPGKVLLEMEDPAALRLEADVPEALIDGVQLGGKYPVQISSLTNLLEGSNEEIAPAADPSSRTFLVKLALPPTRGLRVGQFGRVMIPVGETETLRVPATAIVQRGQMELVFVATDNRAQLRLVKTGKRFGDEIEVLSGLDAGERVVTGGALELTDGQPLALVK